MQYFLVRAAAKSGQTAPVAPVLIVTRTYLVTRCFNPACTEFGCTVEGSDLHYCSSCLSRVSAREVCELELTFARPALAGWELTAVVEPLDGGNLVKRVPGSVNELDLTPFFSGSVGWGVYTEEEYLAEKIRDSKKTAKIEPTRVSVGSDGELTDGKKW